jgi:predicted phosphodiesterase
MDIDRQENESIKKYKVRLFSNKDILNLSSQDIANLINKETGESLNESTYRKWYRAYAEGVEDTKKETLSDDKILKEYELKRIEFEKEKMKFYDQRTAYNKDIRKESRWDEVLDTINKSIQSGDLPKFNYKFDGVIPSENDLLITLSDIHFGLEVENFWNKYNSDICKERLYKYLNKIISIQKLHGAEKCYVCANGDLISGSTHIQIQVANRENIIQQIMGVSELISWFLSELSKYFIEVNFTIVSGNHSRLNTKDNSLKEERLDDLVPWYINARLQNIKNINIHKNNIDNTFSIIHIRSKLFVGIHGDYDSLKNMVSNMTMMIGEKPYGIVTGHLHHNSFDNIQGVKVIMSGSVLGMDDYCIEKRIFGIPQQIVSVCNKDGVDCIYDINLI